MTVATHPPSTTSNPSFVVSLTERASAFLDRRSSRRGFLTRSALVGSALTVAGPTYVMRPGTAYAAVCSCVNRSCTCTDLCCDGYTEFCCAIYGDNSCPPDTLLAGWWKVDNSDFCDGAARYYMDCNKQSPACGCGSSGVCRGTDTTCQCRSCGNRKDGCTVFRYGNCNNDVACVGPIMCRVVTCTKPWEIDPGCTTVPRTDNNTRYHHRPCLEPLPREPTDEELAWVRAIFMDYLGRPATEDDQHHHADMLVRGQSRQAISADFARSDEYIASFLDALYLSVFGRHVDAGGAQTWTNAIRGGMLPSEVAARLYASDEFFRASGSVERFIERLYEEILGRPADESGKQNWIAQIDGGVPRSTVTAQFHASVESRRHRVTGLYDHFLQRRPDASGLETWTTILADGDDLGLASFLSGSDEYFNRAIVRFPPSTTTTSTTSTTTSSTSTTTSTTTP